MIKTCLFPHPCQPLFVKRFVIACLLTLLCVEASIVLALIEYRWRVQVCVSFNAQQFSNASSDSRTYLPPPDLVTGSLKEVPGRQRTPFSDFPVSVTLLIMKDGRADAHGSRAGSSSLPASPSPSNVLPPKRTKISCLPCRQRKSKCDHARPCSSCVLRGTTQLCSDPSAGTAGGSSAGSASSSAATGHFHASHLAEPSYNTVGPAGATSQPRAIAASVSMPSDLSEYAPKSSSPYVDRMGAQHKRRRTGASSKENITTDSFAGTARAVPGITEEIQCIKQSMARLESLLSQAPCAASSSTQKKRQDDNAAADVYEYRIDPSQDTPGETDPPSRAARQRWQHLRSILPPLKDTHRMMHYMFTEGDWLMTCNEAPRFVAIWKYAFERQAISDVFAVRVLTLVACSALFLSDNRDRAIHFAVPIRSLHTQLAKEAVSIIESMPALRSGRTEAESCDMIEIMLNMSLYFRCIGKESLMARFTERAISSSIRAGFDNELRPSWLGLTREQVERRRTIMMELIMSSKWLAFHCRKDLAYLRVMSFNVGQAHLEHIGQLPPLSAWPQSTPIAHQRATQFPDMEDASFTWRIKSERERDTVRTYFHVSTSLTSVIPPLVELVTKTETHLLQPEALAKCTKEEMRDMARQTRQILARLEEWYTVFLPRAGVGYDRAINATITAPDPIEAKTMASILMLNSAVFYMTSILCRAWLLLSDRLQSLSDARKDDDKDYEMPSAVDVSFLAHLKQRSIDHVQHMHAAWLPPTFLSEIQAAVVENGRRCIRSIPVIRKLQSLTSSQFYVGWTCSAHMQAAVNLAIPLVRSHHRHFHQHLDDIDPGFADTTTDSLRRDIVTIFEAVSQLSDNYMAQRAAKVLNRAMHISGISQPLAGGDGYADGVEDAWAAEEQSSTTATKGQMQNAAEGLALLSAASSARTSSDTAASKNSGSSGGSETNSPSLPLLAWESNLRAFPNSHTGLAPVTDKSVPSSNAAVPVVSADEGVSREPMWWEYRMPVETPQQASFGRGGPFAAAGSAVAGHQHQLEQHLQDQQVQQQLHMSDSQLLDELLNFDPSFWQFVLDGTGISSTDNNDATSVRA